MKRLSRLGIILLVLVTLACEPPRQDRVSPSSPTPGNSPTPMTSPAPSATYTPSVLEKRQDAVENQWLLDESMREHLKRRR